MAKQELEALFHCVYALHYHLVIVTKHRRRMLTKPILDRFDEGRSSLGAIKVDSAILPEAGFDLPGWPERAAAIKNSVDLFRDRAARAIARRSGVRELKA